MFARQTRVALAGILIGVVVLFSGMSAEAQSDYRVRSGDTLQIEVLEDPSLNRTVLILPDGSFSFPFIGTIRARGSNIDQIRGQLVSGLSPNFANPPTVVVSVSSLAQQQQTAAVSSTIDVYIMGEVNNPGRIEADPGITILQFLAQAGGLTPFAARSRIELHRTNTSTGETSVFLFSREGNGRGPRIGAGTVLLPGDVVVVPSRRLFE
ncbi:MAG: polysaccharide biosynthesis/export family protein [Pseudomonadota bacterium]